MVYSGSIPDTPRHNKQKEGVKMDNYKVIEQKLSNLESFRGNTLNGYWGETDGNGFYYAVSYNTLIATYDPYTKKAWVNPNKYSVTTSKHQNIIRRAWGIK
jgi:hypothetical protein